MSTDDEIVTQTAIILSKSTVSLGYMGGVIPGDAETDPDLMEALGGGLVKPPIDPARALQAVASDGDLAAVCQAVANGTAGATYAIVPRSELEQKGFKLSDPATWPPEAKEQHNSLQAFVQAGFVGKGAQSLQQGFYEQEHDRVILGWGGVVVFRDDTPFAEGMPSKPRSLGRFQACAAQFSRPDVTATMVPIPISLIDGSVIWIEEPRHFRRIRVQPEEGGRPVWYKQYGDWRAMDQRTGTYSKTYARAIRKTGALKAEYKPGKLPKDAVPALEVVHWATSFPGADPYGMSAWHSELSSVDISKEAAGLVLEHLKSGLHSVILAASDRPFDDASAKQAIETIDSLGRGRKGLGALITLNLTPMDSSAAAAKSPWYGDDKSSDRGKLVLQELNTKLSTEILDGTVRDVSGTKYASAERIPAIILGKSEAYNFATAVAAWEVVNQLRFAPHHEARNAFLSRLLVEMGITFWTIIVKPADWSKEVPLAGVASVVSQGSGMTPNEGVRLLAKATGQPFEPFEEWWGEIPMPILTHILQASDPAAMLRLFGYEEQARKFKPSDPSQIVASVAAKATQIDQQAEKGVTNG